MHSLGLWKILVVNEVGHFEVNCNFMIKSHITGVYRGKWIYGALYKKKKIVMFALAIAWLRKDKETCNEERCIYLNQILFVVRSQTAAEFWIFWWLSVYLNFRIGKKYPKTLKVSGKWCSAFEHSKLISVNVWPNKKQKFCRAVLLIQLVYA